MSDPAFQIIDPGLFTTVQDLGRHTYQRYGVPVSGAMDAFALQAANLLVGNVPIMPAAKLKPSVALLMAAKVLLPSSPN